MKNRIIGQTSRIAFAAVVICLFFSTTRVSAQSCTSLGDAVVRGDISALAGLIDTGANLNAMCNGWTPLIHAVYNDKLDIVRLLVNKGADVNLGGDPKLTSRELPLGLAAWKNNSGMVDILIASGADPNAKDGTGRSALDYAKQWKNVEMEQRLTGGRPAGHVPQQITEERGIYTAPVPVRSQVDNSSRSSGRVNIQDPTW